MESSELNPDHEPETVEAEQASSEQGETMSDLLKHLRARRYQQGGELDLSSAAPVEEEREREIELSDDRSGNDEMSPPIDFVEGDSDEIDITASIDEIGQEVRRLGRELFKSNRVAEANQELFNDTLVEIRRLAAIIDRVTTQSAESLNDAKFEAKAQMCRELLRMADTIEVSISSADELLRRIESRAPQDKRGLAFLFHSGKQMYDLLVDSLAALRQWRDGQQLLAGRLQAILQSAGVREIESINRVFDPSIHRAVSTQLQPELPSNTIIGEELKGYTLEGRILRYAEVIVAKNG